MPTVLASSSTEDAAASLVQPCRGLCVAAPRGVIGGDSAAFRGVSVLPGGQRGGSPSYESSFGAEASTASEVAHGKRRGGERGGGERVRAANGDLSIDPKRAQKSVAAE